MLDRDRKKGIGSIRRRNGSKDKSSFDDEGVAEVVGNILTLAVTVVIFTSVFAAVTQLEGPDEEPHLEFDVEYEYTLDADYLNITHIGGKSLDLEDHTFIIVVDNDSVSDSATYEIEDGQVTTTSDDSSFTIGEEVHIKIEDELEVLPRTELMIRQNSNSRIIYQTLLLEEDRELLDIRNPRIDYKFIWREHAEPGEEITIRAKVVAPIYLRRDEFDPEKINVTASAIQKGVLYDEEEEKRVEEVELEHGHDGEFHSVNISVDDDADYVSYSIKISASHTSEDFEATPKYISLHVGEPAARRYRADLVIGDIDYRPKSPTHNQEFTVEIEVFNRGALNYTADWNLTDNGDLKYENTTKFMSGPDPTVVVAKYDITGVDHHEIEVTVDNTLVGPDGNERDDVETENNQKSFEVYVDPSILIVRDWTAGESDELGLMENSLKDLNFDYGVWNVEKGGLYPDRDYLSDYSVCIWLTGDILPDDDDKFEPLPPTAQDDLTEFIEKDEGKLWLMGSNLEKVNFQSDFRSLLGSDGEAEITVDKELRNPQNDEEGTYGNFTYPVYPSKAHELSLKPGVKSKNRLEHDGSEVVGAGYEGNPKERTALNSHLFESISDPAARSNMAQEVIKWLSNITIRTGTDVSVSSQSITPTAPMFMDNITIKATLRNNGPEDLNVTVRAVRNGGEEVLEPLLVNPWLHIPKNGGTAEVEFTWQADELGVQEFLVVADYYDEIDDASLENNDITYKDLEITEDVVEVQVQYSTLVVDADVSEDQGYENVTEHVTDSLDRLGQVRGETYDYYMVEKPDEHGPPVDEMTTYNAILWVTGERGKDAGQSIVFTQEDVNRLLEYFRTEEQGNVMFMGENILDYLDENAYGSEDVIDAGDAEDLIEYMGVHPSDGNIDDGSSSPTHLIGEENSSLGHNLRYELSGATGIETFSQTSMHGEVLFTDGNDNIASVYDDGSIRNVYMGVNIHNLSEPLLTGEDFESWPGGQVDLSYESVRDEFIYNSLWSFGMRDQRTELRVTDYDIELSTDHPETGRSYEVTVEIENIGYKGASTMVRVKEGEDHVGTQTVFVEGSRRESSGGVSYFDVEPGSVTVEFTWEPIFAGERPLRVKVDPLRLVNEIEPDGEEGREDKIMEFHNQAVITNPVYYFYDDMENGSDKWEYDATLMNIDGVSPLNFIGRKDVDTNVKGEWDEGLTEGVVKQDNHSRTPPYSYFIEEQGEIKGGDVILGIVIDNSPSMTDRQNATGATWLEVAKKAALTLVDSLSNESVVGVYDFKGANPNRMIYPTELSGTGRDDVEDAINNIKSKGNTNTVIWDATGMAYMDIHSEAPSYPDLTPSLISLTDGADYQAADNSAYKEQSLEAGSEEWCPWGNLTWSGGNVEEENYPSHWGKYWFYKDSQPGKWKEAGTYGGAYFEDRKGLLNSDIPIYTVGLALEHYAPPNANPRYSTPTDGEQDDSSHIEGTESGTVEYNLWRISNTSNAKYFYSPNSEELIDIFKELANLITDPGELRSVDDPGPVSEGSDDSIMEETFNEYEARAVTPPIDLTEANSAELSFWHRYKLLEGVNGAYLQIGFEDNDGDYKWHYVEPTDGAYNGNLLLQDEMPQDDFDNKIMWVWNRKSAQGTLDWEYSSMDLQRKVDNIMEEEGHRIPDDALENVRVGFYYTHYGYPLENGGWWLDNVNVKASSEWSRDGPGYWNLTSASQLDDMGITNYQGGLQNYYDHTHGSEDGKYWIFTTENNDKDELPPGIDSSLYTRPIYLDTADNPVLTAHMKFNIEESAAMPPDGFRVEISDDDGATWDSITYGARTGWGASGDTEHGEYSGETDDGNYGWVDGDSLARLKTDLSGWRGERIILRFRVFTNTTQEYDDPNLPGAIFLDDVWITERNMTIDQKSQSLAFDGVTDHGKVRDSPFTPSSTEDSEDLASEMDFPKQVDVFNIEEDIRAIKSAESRCNQRVNIEFSSIASKRTLVSKD
ncbi:MAG: CARDB domain-containing protein [Candidatus Thermoplasmatota archaeon]